MKRRTLFKYLFGLISLPFVAKAFKSDTNKAVEPKSQQQEIVPSKNDVQLVAFSAAEKRNDRMGPISYDEYFKKWEGYKPLLYIIKGSPEEIVFRQAYTAALMLSVTQCNEENSNYDPIANANQIMKKMLEQCSRSNFYPKIEKVFYKK